MSLGLGSWLSPGIVSVLMSCVTDSQLTLDGARHGDKTPLPLTVLTLCYQVFITAPTSALNDWTTTRPNHSTQTSIFLDTCFPYSFHDWSFNQSALFLLLASFPNHLTYDLCPLFFLRPLPNRSMLLTFSLSPLNIILISCFFSSSPPSSKTSLDSALSHPSSQPKCKLFKTKLPKRYVCGKTWLKEYIFGPLWFLLQFTSHPLVTVAVGVSLTVATLPHI